MFDRLPGDVHFCTADLGWITGHASLVSGPPLTQAPTLLFESTAVSPDASRLWRVVDDLKARSLSTAPTALRALIREGDDHVKRTSRKSLRLLASAAPTRGGRRRLAGS